MERTFPNVGWRADEIVPRASDADDFALYTCDQIAVPQWHDGRAVLLGNSAWCASPLSGLGTALALLGSEALAEELSDGTSVIEEAFTAYEERMPRPALRARKLLPGRVGMFSPMTRLGIYGWALVWKVAQWRVAAPILK